MHTSDAVKEAFANMDDVMRASMQNLRLMQQRVRAIMPKIQEIVRESVAQPAQGAALPSPPSPSPSP